MRYNKYLELYPNGRPYFGSAQDDSDDVSLPNADRQRLYQENLATLAEAIKNPTANGWIARSGNIPTFEQWAASNPEIMGDNDPRYQYLQQFYEGTNKSDLFETLGPMLAMGAMGAAAGGAFGNLSTYGSAGGTFGTAGSAISGADAGLIENAIQTQGMGGNQSMGFFDDILNIPEGVDMTGFTQPDPFAFNTQSPFGQLPDVSQWSNPLELTGQMTPSSIPNSELAGFLNPNFTVNLANSAELIPSLGSGFSIPGMDTLSKIASGVKSIFGGSGGGGLDISKLIPGGRDLFGSSLALAPSLAAINYAKNQSPFDTSKLESAYSQVSPDGLTGLYDIQTGQGRNALTSSLTSRGVMGSSFGNADIANYNTTRDIGRQNLLSSGANTQANIASQILNAQIKEREQKNNLYGRALLALSGGLMPRGAF
jgi:hypothetical protein